MAEQVVHNEQGDRVFMTNKEILKKLERPTVSGANKEQKAFLEKNKMNG